MAFSYKVGFQAINMTMQAYLDCDFPSMTIAKYKFRWRRRIESSCLVRIQFVISTFVAPQKIKFKSTVSLSYRSPSHQSQPSGNQIQISLISTLSCSIYNIISQHILTDTKRLNRPVDDHQGLSIFYKVKVLFVIISRIHFCCIAAIAFKQHVIIS